jgi:hypothetical protein
MAVWKPWLRRKAGALECVKAGAVRGFRRIVVGLCASAVATSVLIAALPRPATAAIDKPTVVLDPDDNLSHGLHDGVTSFELPITYDVAQAVKVELPAVCDAEITITRDASQDFVSRASRAAQMTDAGTGCRLQGFDPCAHIGGRNLRP